MTNVGRQVIAKAHIAIGQMSYEGLQTNVWNIKTSDELFNEIRTIWENMTLDYTVTWLHKTCFWGTCNKDERSSYKVFN